MENAPIVVVGTLSGCHELMIVLFPQILSSKRCFSNYLFLFIVYYFVHFRNEEQRVRTFISSIICWVLLVFDLPFPSPQLTHPVYSWFLFILNGKTINPATLKDGGGEAERKTIHWSKERITLNVSILFVYLLRRQIKFIVCSPARFQFNGKLWQYLLKNKF